MSDIYRTHILDHYANPRNAGRVENPDIAADADDPSCGDQVRIEVALDDAGRAAQVAFEGEGCLVSMASASLLTEHIKGKSLAELEALTEDDVLGLIETPIPTNRRRCALLPLLVLRAGLEDYHRKAKKREG